MKEIIYLNTSILNSFIAQQFEGLPLQISTESQNQTTESSEKSVGTDSKSFIEATGKTGKLNIPGLFETPSAEIKTRIQPGESTNEKILLSEVEAGKEIISKQLHDNGLILFEKFLEENGHLVELNDTEEIETGKYIKISSKFTLLDLDQFSNIFSEDYFELFMNPKKYPEEVLKEIEKVKLKGLGKQKEGEQIKKIKATYEMETEESKMELQDSVNTLKYVAKSLPSPSMIKVDNALAILKKEFLREDFMTLSFNYNRDHSDLNIALLGKITGKVSTLEYPDFSDASPHTLLMDLNKIIFALLGNLEFIHKDDLIISPVALYFE
jgi:hypothetical protein